MNRIKQILLSVLGEKKYLSLLSSSFQKIYKTELTGKNYQDIYFLKNLIRPGDYCIDIGAHLGYFTLEMSRLCGNDGHVFAIEPMSKFFNTLRGMVGNKKLENITLYQHAMGADSEYVEMGIPRVNNVKKFAYARVMKTSTFLEYVESEKVKNETGDRLFLDLPRLDYIKCDVEGLEYEVFASMTRTLATHHPILLCELFERGQRIKLFELIRPMGYQAYTLNDGRLKPLDVYVEGTIVSQNNYFVPLQQEERLKDLGIIAPATNPASR